VEIVLLRSQEAREAYHEILETLNLPGCQALIVDASKTVSNYASDLGEFTDKVIQAAQKGEGLPLDNLYKYANNQDYLAYIQRIRDFIKIGFNRPIDRENERCKVKLDKLEDAPILFAFIVCRTIAEYCKVKLENWDRYRPELVNRIMRSNPTTRQDRWFKKMLIRAYKRNAWTLRRNSKLLKDADQWYGCRVDPGSIETYLDQQAEQGITLDRGRIQNDIAPYDDVTGYPRKWRR
jgi:predicted small integral membrane protein